MKYAVAQIKGNQYVIYEGKPFLVSKLNATKVDAAVLAIRDGEEIELGKPYLERKLNFKILSPIVKGEKVSILKYKSKSRYRKRSGIRPVFSEVVVEKF